MIGKTFAIAILMMSASMVVHANDEQPAECADVLNHTFNKLNSSEALSMCQQFNGKVLLIVNTASQCGFTSQFEQLENIYQQYKGRGFTVIGFPSNDFRQDRGSEADTAKVCYLDYGVTFPMMERTQIRGVSANPVFKVLAEKSGITPKWNFYKYLVDRDGEVVSVFASSTLPTDDAITEMIDNLL